jgi:glutamyl-tRNA reductase
MIAAEVGGKASPLFEIKGFKDGFDVLISCTGAEEAVVSKALFKELLGGDKSRKVLIDLALPGDFDPEIFDASPVKIDHINIEELRATAEVNMKLRSQEISRCEEIIDNNMHEFHEMYHTRRIELAMRAVPESVKEIRKNAMQTVYAKDLEGLNPESREVLEKIITYMERKYISVPMKMAKEVMLNSKK